jgi:transposase-like protein
MHIREPEYIQGQRKANGGAGNDAYMPHFAEEVYWLRLLSAPVALIAERFGVCDNTIRNWRHEHPEFNAKWQEGDLIADAQVANALFRKATGFYVREERVSEDGTISSQTKYITPDVAAQKFWLTNRARTQWVERTQQELTGAGGEKLIPPTLVLKALEGPSEEKA